MPADARRAVVVSAPGRLHLGFLDPSGTLGRPFGSLGLVIDGFETALELSPARADAWHADGQDAHAELDRARSCLRRLREHTGVDAPVRLHLQQVLPPHAGFGSGTQLALAVGRAFARCHGLDVSTPTLAQWLGRGLRSGIGIAGFDHGGLLLDGGPGAQGQPAALLSRLEWPADWRVVVVQDTRHRGLSGSQERQALAGLPGLPQAEAADLCHQVLMRILPGAAGGEFQAFASGLNHLQERLGAHFAPAQSGSAWTSPAVGRLMHWLRSAAGDTVALGQSSWGPTGFVAVPTADAAEHWLAAARAAGAVDAALDLRTVGGRNHGATVSEPPAH